MLWAVSTVSGGGANTWVGRHGCCPASIAQTYWGGFSLANTLGSPRKGLFRSKQGSGECSRGASLSAKCRPSP